MNYRELTVPEDLRALVKSCWTLTYSDVHRVPKRQTATPDVRVLRFQEAFSAAPATRNISTLAANCGYFDHPHLARDFRAIGGCTAAEARKLGKGPFID